MAKIESIMDLLNAGVRAEGLRQKAIAANIANIETPGYRRQDVKFEELLADALRSSASLDLAEVEPQLYQPKTAQTKPNGNDVSVETEVGEMIKNSLRQKAFMRLLSSKYRQIESAIDTSRT
jgi:flagellar basal-body rod protein FlgB